MIRRSLYAKGVSRLFVELVQDMLQISVLVIPKTEKNRLDWTIQFQNARVLEDRYVSILMSEDTVRDQDATSLKRREEYYRNRFRKYMNRFQLYRTNRDKFDLNISIKERHIVVEECDESIPVF
jgi:transcription initiation factor IIF auxiliary subunit